jgi:hypothetical protein
MADVVESPLLDEDQDQAVRAGHEDAVAFRSRAVSSRGRQFALLVLASALGLAVVLLMTGGRSHAPAAAGVAKPGGRSHAPAAPERGSPPSITADFALLRSPAVDPLPGIYLSAVRHVPAKYKIMPSWARESVDDVWLVPGRNGLCLFGTDGEGPHTVCGLRAAAEREGVSFYVRDQSSGRELWTGAVPDRTVRVRAIGADGATLAVATPHSSIYELTATNAQRVSAER